MRNITIIFLLTVLATITPLYIYSNSSAKLNAVKDTVFISRTSLTAGFNFTQGNFGNYSKIKELSDWGLWPNSQESPLASKHGLIIGIKTVFPKTDYGFSPWISIDFIFNQTNSKEITQHLQERKDVWDEFTYENTIEHKLPNQINFPLTTGINYAIHLYPNLNMLFDLGIGLNTSKIFSFNEKVVWQDWSEGEPNNVNTKINYNIDFTFISQASVSLLFKDKYVLSFQYYLSSKSEIHGNSLTTYERAPALLRDYVKQLDGDFINPGCSLKIFSLKIGYLF